MTLALKPWYQAVLVLIAVLILLSLIFLVTPGSLIVAVIWLAIAAALWIPGHRT